MRNEKRTTVADILMVKHSYPAEQDSQHTYLLRLAQLAKHHNMDAERLKALIEDAFGTPTNIPEESESVHALRHLVRLGIKVRELNWLFSYHVVPE